MTRSSDFSETVRKGRRVKRGCVLVYSHSHTSGHSVGSGNQPVDSEAKFGLIISKQVGNSVVRHRVARVLRHQIRPWLEQFDPGNRIVVRALPHSGVRSGSVIARDLERCLQSVTGGADA